MTVAHHASDETLAYYAAGTLKAGPSLVLRTHLSHCPACRARIEQFEAVGGALMESLPPSELFPDALEKTLARMDRAGPTNVKTSAQVSAQPIVLPEPLRHYKVSKWRWMAPGVHYASVDVKDDNVFLIKVAPGKSLPNHTHTGVEYACVISGAFRDATGRYGPGDMAEADAELEHVPVVEQGEPCVCLFAIEGKIRFLGLIPRLLQPILRF